MSPIACWLLLLLVASQELAPQEPPLALTHGPFLGHCDPDSATVWARASRPGEYALELTSAEPAHRQRIVVSTDAARDLTMLWKVEGLEPAHEYTFRIQHRGETLHDDGLLRSGPAADSPRVTLALASCADDQRFPEQPGWAAMLANGAEALVLLGDMPYIDSTELAVQRRRYREFYAVPEVARALAAVPFYATWDDHDFGRNDTDGRLPGKQNSRIAFREYHANPSYGRAGEGVYCHFRRGPIEVFLLDARTFAGTAPSPVDPERPTLLGAEQWAWLQRELAASTATFKVLATGMIWNGATRPLKTDHWMTYPHERQAVFDFIGDQEISGVLLVGGDIHRSRALRYPTSESVGYELTELITSPLANTVIEAANAPSPHLLHDVGQQQTFLLLSADTSARPATLVGTCRNAAGEDLFVVQLDLDQLTAE